MALLVALHALSLPASAPLVPASGPLQGPSNATSLYSFGDLRRRNILYAVSTCEKYHATRALAVFQTWCNNSEACLFYSDHNSVTAPITVQIDVVGGGHLDELRRAQLRYPRILKHASDLLLTDRTGVYQDTRWLVVADDDTYVFHYNMLTYLSTLDHSKPIYTGHTLIDSIYPIDGDGEGHHLPVRVTTHFACGGGGSVFSIPALKQMTWYLPSCLRDMADGGKWAGWQSDWVYGACADRAGVPLLNQDPYDSRFGQFLFQNHMPALASDPGVKDYCAYNSGVCAEPVSIHPVALPLAMRELHGSIPHTHEQPVKHVKIQLKPDDNLIVSFNS